MLKNGLNKCLCLFAVPCHVPILFAFMRRPPGQIVQPMVTSSDRNSQSCLHSLGEGIFSRTTSRGLLNVVFWYITRRQTRSPCTGHFYYRPISDDPPPFLYEGWFQRCSNWILRTLNSLYFVPIAYHYIYLILT